MLGDHKSDRAIIDFVDAIDFASRRWEPSGKPLSEKTQRARDRRLVEAVKDALAKYAKAFEEKAGLR